MARNERIKSLAYPVDENRRWAFKIVPDDDTTAPPVVKYFVDKGVKTIGIMGFNDAYLQVWTGLFEKLSANRHQGRCSRVIRAHGDVDDTASPQADRGKA